MKCHCDCCRFWEERVRKLVGALNLQDAKLTQIWGKEEDPYACAYGWSKLKRQDALASVPERVREEAWTETRNEFDTIDLPERPPSE